MRDAVPAELGQLGQAHADTSTHGSSRGAATSPLWPIMPRLERYFGKPLADLPIDLAVFVSSNDFMVVWDEVGEERRRNEASEWDRQNDPTVELRRQKHFGIWLERDEIARQVERWEHATTNSATEIQLQAEAVKKLREQDIKLANTADEVEKLSGVALAFPKPGASDTGREGDTSLPFAENSSMTPLPQEPMANGVAEAAGSGTGTTTELVGPATLPILRNRGRWSKYELMKLVDDHCKGMTHSEIADDRGVSRQLIGRKLAQAKKNFRNPKTASPFDPLRGVSRKK